MLNRRISANVFTSLLPSNSDHVMIHVEGYKLYNKSNETDCTREYLQTGKYK